jgi:hypothetical protein
VLSLLVKELLRDFLAAHSSVFTREAKLLLSLRPPAPDMGLQAERYGYTIREHKRTMEALVRYKNEAVGLS